MKMKKKLKYVLLLAMLCFGLSACGAEPEHIPFDDSVLMSSQNHPVIIYYMMQSYVDVTEEDFEATKELVTHSIEIGESGYTEQDKVLLSAVSAYRDNVEDIGDVPVVDQMAIMGWMYGGEYPADLPTLYYTAGEDKGVIAHMLVQGSKHNATIELYYNKFNELTNVNVSVQLELSESMQKAGVNTLIGMGTVFCMLILIMFIISAMKIIPTLQSAMDKKKEAAKGSEASIDNTIAGIIEREEAEADSDELIAVIAAAIAAASAESGETGDFVVRSIRRIR